MLYRTTVRIDDELLAELKALAARQHRTQPHAHVVGPGGRFWAIFRDLCLKSGAMGELMPDAYLAALSIEHGCEFITADEGFRKFPGLRWRHPLN